MKSFYVHVQNILSFNEMISQIFNEQSSIGIRRKKGSFFVKNNQIGFLDLDLNVDNRKLIFLYLPFWSNYRQCLNSYIHLALNVFLKFWVLNLKKDSDLV